MKFCILQVAIASIDEWDQETEENETTRPSFWMRTDRWTNHENPLEDIAKMTRVDYRF